MFLSSLRRVGAAHARLAQHLADCAPFVLPAKLEVAHTESSGLGLRTHQRVDAGEPLLRVPESLWSPFSADTAVSHARAKAAPLVARLDKISSGLPEEHERLTQVVCLALHLLLERGSGGSAYAETLPVPDVPLLTWSGDDLAALAGTRTHAAVLARRSFVHAVHEHVFGAQSPVSVAQLTWALATITSRALSDPLAPMTLCPVLDLTNHAADASCQHSYDAATRSFVLIAKRTLDPGEQVTISYGTALDNDRLLRLYGFTEHSNKIAGAALLPPPWPAPRPDDPLRAKKLRTLRRPDVAAVPAGQGGECWWWDAEADARPVSVAGRADAQPLLAVLRVMHLAPGDVVAEHVDATRPVSAANEAAVRASMEAAVRRALDAYPSLQQAEDALAWHAAGASAPPRLLHASRIVAGESSTLRSLLTDG